MKRGNFPQSQNFPWIIRQKGMSFRRIICGNLKLSADYSLKSSLLLMNISAKSNKILKTFRKVICGKSKFYADHIAERYAFLKIIFRKSDLSADYPVENLSIPRKIKI
jgi:hypothetical protein